MVFPCFIPHSVINFKLFHLKPFSLIQFYDTHLFKFTSLAQSTLNKIEIIEDSIFPVISFVKMKWKKWYR